MHETRSRLLRTAQSRPIVKICGNVFFEDSMMVSAHRPDLMGWIFSPHSRRRVTAESAARQIASIRRERPEIFHVGVFAGNSIPDMLRVIEAIGSFDFIQISDGPGVTSEMRRILGREIDILPVLRVSSPVEDSVLSAFMPADWVLLDAYSPTALGGTGISIDLGWISGVRHRHILAGGLTPDNVIERLNGCNASGADVASGVESAEGMRTGPGRKDPEKVRRFIEAVRSIQFVR